MSINPTILLNKVKRRLGVSQMILPLSDDDLMDIVYEDSLRTFSVYFPNYAKIHINKNDRVPGLKNTYYIKAEEYFGEDVEVINVNDISIGDYSLESMYGFPNMYAFTPMQTISMQLTADLSSINNLPITFEFLPPNMIRIDAENKTTSDFMIELSLVHPKNLKTIALGYYDDFFKIALLDIQASLYPIMKHMDRIDTTFGTIELRIDDWSDAESKREQIIENWATKYLASRRKKIYSA